MTRKDNRSLEQFKKDIEQTTCEQAIILSKWLIAIGYADLRFRDNGIDNEGKYISDIRKITNDPDYDVDLFGLVEVQYAKPKCDTFFHIKKEKLLTCRNLRAILMVDGWQTDCPKYVLINDKQMKVIEARCSVVKWQGAGGKDAYQIPLEWFDWLDLKK